MYGDSLLETVGCNNGIGGIHENPVTSKYPKLPDFMGSKDAPEKMKFFGAIKKVASLGTFIQNAKWQETSTDSAVTRPN